MSARGAPGTKSGGRPRRPISKTDLKAFLGRLVPLSGPVLAGLGLELAWAASRLTGGRATVQLFIDRASAVAGGSSVSLDDCAAASRALEAAVEEAGWPEEPEGYFLEVSSPGLDRPLFTETEARRFQGRSVRLKLRRDGKIMVYKGRLALSAAGGLALATNSETLIFDWSEVVSGRLYSGEVKD